MLEKTLESPLDCKEIQPVNSKGNQSWIFIGRTDAEVETPILWPPDAMSQLIRRNPDAGKDWRQEEKGVTEDEIVGWHQWVNGHEFAQTPGDGDGQGSLACCSLWDHKELDMTEQLYNRSNHLIVPMQNNVFLKCLLISITCRWLPSYYHMILKLRINVFPRNLN